MLQDDSHHVDAGTDAFVEMRRIHKVFRTPVGDFHALEDVDIALRRGEFVSVVGKSGSGKSTLANMLTGIDHPTSGEVRIGDTYVHQLSESQMARWRGTHLGIVFQFYQLLPMLSLLENTMLPMDLAGSYDPRQREQRAMMLLDRVGLSDVAHKRPLEVSGGQQQSAAIARALANDPPLIVADEPTGNLDSRAAQSVFGIFEELSQQGKTIVMVTHDNGLAARAARTILLADGQVVDRTVAQVLPFLTHQQMLTMTKHAQHIEFAPGETILREGEPAGAFYMIASGRADVLVRSRRGEDVPVAQLGPGQHFGEIEVLQDRPTAVASIRAASGWHVGVLSLARHVLSGLLLESAALRDYLWQAVQARLAQNADPQYRGGQGLYASPQMA
jgi:ABC-type lipoprotein export system ATPase subunit